MMRTSEKERRAGNNDQCCSVWDVVWTSIDAHASRRDISASAPVRSAVANNNFPVNWLFMMTPVHTAVMYYRDDVHAIDDEELYIEANACMTKFGRAVYYVACR